MCVSGIANYVQNLFRYCVWLRVGGRVTFRRCNSQHCNLLLRLLLGGGDQRCARMRKLVAFDLVVVLVFVLGSIVSPFSMVAEGAHFRFVPRSARNLVENSHNHAVPAYLAPPLEFGFYHKTCPQFPEIVKRVVTKEFELSPTNAAPQLRLFFHDCFVQGCDASVLVNSTKVNQAEKDASNNFSLGNFFVIDEVKEQLEKECPGVVSCADILALVAVYSIKAVRINFSGEFAAIKSLWVL